MDTAIRDESGRAASELVAEERQRLLSRMLSRLAHEIRNPLSSLDVHVQLLEEDLGALGPPLPPALTGRLEIIHHELHRLDAIVRQYLSLAAPAAADLQPLDLATALRHVTRLLGPAAAERGIGLAVDLPPAPPVVLADAGQIQQALINLVLNAIQALDRGGRILLSVGVDTARSVLCLRVADTGPGVDPARRAAIFEPFYTTKPEGSGVGLWIVQQIALAHGGSIAVDATGTGGALFTLELPLPPAGNAPLP
jgi:signal transduction histidine kinase